MRVELYELFWSERQPQAQPLPGTHSACGTCQPSVSLNLSFLLHGRGPYLGLAAFFALTTPCGVAIGLGVRSTYNANSPTALATAGVFDSISTGILIYMALVRVMLLIDLACRLGSLLSSPAGSKSR